MLRFSGKAPNVGEDAATGSDLTGLTGPSRSRGKSGGMDDLQDRDADDLIKFMDAGPQDSINMR